MSREVEKSKAVPLDLYRAQVDSTFGDAFTLAIGSIGACAGGLCVVFRHFSWINLAIIVALALVGAFRLWTFRLYRNFPSANASRDALRKWELLYQLGASVHVSLTGVFFFVNFAILNDEFGKLVGLSGVMAYLVGVPGRNFANNNLVNILIICAGAPVIAGMMLAGDGYWLYIVGVFIPFLASMRTISIRLRGIFLEAVFRARDVSLLAARFDSALNNMPSGLAMLDADGRVAVTNRKLRELLKLPEDRASRGFSSLGDLFTDCAAAGVLDPERVEAAIAGLKAHLERDVASELLLELRDGRVLNLASQPMQNGGAVVLFEDVTERNLAQARINELARFDSLTRLPNRMEFGERATAILDTKPDDLDVAVLFVDLDQFKQVNDTLGHVVGDQLICAAAERLRGAAGPKDLVARLGGDEFVVLIEAVDTVAEIEAIARTIVDDMTLPFEIAGNTIRLSASIGIARAVDVGADLSVLLKSADMALHQAKSDGRAVWRFFEPRMEARARERRNLEFELRLALEDEELDIAYQPIYNVAKGEFLGCEALLRWRHPVLGRISPAVFVPIAEEIGLVVKLDEWVLRRACRAAMAWPTDTKVAVNFSAIHFQTTEIIATVSSALAESGLAPQRLEIEITESAFLQNKQLAHAILSDLRKLGVRISLDDFGTGYSSLSYLHSLPLNKIKIDRSFLNGLEGDARARKLLYGVTRLSRDLGLTIVVEGVETEDQFNLVTGATPVDEIQGFYFSPPIAKDEITELFQRPRRSAA